MALTLDIPQRLLQRTGDGLLRELRPLVLLGLSHIPDAVGRVAQRVLVDDCLHHAEDATLVRLVDAHGLVIVVARREPLRPVLVLEVGLDGRAAVVVGHDDLARARHVLRPHQQAVALVEVVVAHAVALDDDQPAFARYVLHRDRSRLVGVVAVLVGNARTPPALLAHEVHKFVFFHDVFVICFAFHDLVFYRIQVRVVSERKGTELFRHDQKLCVIFFVSLHKTIPPTKKRRGQPQKAYPRL